MDWKNAVHISQSISKAVLSVYCLAGAVNSNANDVTPYVVGGSEVAFGEQNWMVTLRANQVNEAPFCGGTVIDDNWVLTAAHCVVIGGKDATDASSYYVLQPNRITIVAGVTDLEQTGVKHSYPVSHVIIHPDYTPFDRQIVYEEADGTTVSELVHTALNNDLALLRVSRAFDDTITPIALADRAGAEQIDAILKSQWREELRPKNVIVSGWGAIDPAGTSQSTILKQAELSFVPVDECYKRLETGNDALLIIDSPANITKVCTLPPEVLTPGGFVGADSCKGDSGGPLRAQNHYGEWVQHGIVSGGPGGLPVCGSLNRPSFYTRVGTYYDWIQSYMGTVPANSVEGPDIMKKNCNSGSGGVTATNCEMIDGGGGSISWHWLLMLLLPAVWRCRGQDRKS
ncbi:S1 family peptidase [Photobacterium lipolyticum]|uniref:Serine protease n=1 Tax=Photobacterium lipolyticum TaxID=266810 RepID=A0A2T3N2B6_9GAMM|nr:serine protease [Photobacterium lipolyticum]PSW06517.1 serine protease [Photobacterium lipolyticum]